MTSPPPSGRVPRVGLVLGRRTAVPPAADEVELMEEARLQPTFGNVNEAVSLLPRSQPPPAAFPPETGPVAHAQPQQQAAAAGAECTPSFGEPESERHRIVVLCLVALFSFMAGYAFGVYNTSVPGQMRPTAFVPSSDG